MRGQPSLVVKSTSHIVGHLLREIESAIRVVLTIPIEGIAGIERAVSEQARHQTTIRAILAALGVDPAQEAWANDASLFNDLPEI